MSEIIKIRFLKPYFPRAALTANNLEFWVGREAQIDRVVRGLLASSEAHYLITGYPGVGKTSFVSRVIAEWRRLSALQGINRVLIFNLQFAQPQSSEEVVRKLIGKVYFGSLDGQFFPNKRLAERLQLNFIQAYSKSLKETQAEIATKDKGGEANLPKVTSLIGGELKLSLKSSKESSKSIEIQREYNLSAVISDFEAVIHLLTKPEGHKDGRHWPFWPFSIKRTRTVPAQVLFIIDQIDNLNGLRELSNLFALPNASFLVIGGIGLKEEMASVQEKGIHVLDNFQEEYLSCQWNQADKILSRLISEKDIGQRRFSDYRDYLNFFAQGLPRRLFSAIDQHTNLDGDEFYLQLTSADVLRVRLGAKLHRIIWKNRRDILGEYIDSVQYYMRDKALRGTYHLADRIFRTAKFTFNDANTLATQMSDIIIHRERERVLRNLLRAFVGEGLIINNGNIYSLADDMLKWVKKIPDWLKDGFVDAQDFLDDFTLYNAADLRDTDVVYVSPEHAIPKPKDDITRVIPREKFIPLALPDTPVRIDRYEILKKLGSGGMGDVYLARDKSLARLVALKVIHASIGTSSDFRGRFLREGRVVARLSHPSIVQIYDIQQLPSGQIVLVTEYIEGQSLEQLIKEPMAIHEALRISIEIAKALEVAHNMAVIHRDVKPSNILISSGGDIKLLDFGIAKFVNDTTTTETEITSPGVAIGTAAYMSPEQMRGETVDPRTDIYSLGAVMYQMLTGKPYLSDDSAIGLMIKVINELPAPPSTFNPLIPPELDNIILRCLEKNPKERFNSAMEVIQSLESVLSVKQV